MDTFRAHLPGHQQYGHSPAVETCGGMGIGARAAKPETAAGSAGPGLEGRVHAGPDTWTAGEPDPAGEGDHGFYRTHRKPGRAADPGAVYRQVWRGDRPLQCASCGFSFQGLGKAGELICGRPDGVAAPNVYYADRAL